MAIFKLGLLSILMSFIIASHASAEKQVCKDLKTISEWDLKLNFAKLSGGNNDIMKLAHSQEYQQAYQSYYRLIQSMKRAHATSYTQSLLRSMITCIEDIPNHRMRQVPSLMGYNLSTPYSPEVFSQELLAQIESNPQFQKSLLDSIGKDHYDNLVGYLKTSDFDETTFLKILNGISISSTVVAVGLVIGFIMAVVSGGLAAMFIIPVVFVGSLLVTMVDTAYVSIDSMRANRAVRKMDDKTKAEISKESARIAELIIQNSVKTKLSQDSNSIQNRLN
jgi:hypothetical protein